MDFDGDDFDPLPASASPSPPPQQQQQQSGLSAVAFGLANVADQARRPWAFGFGKTNAAYVPQECDKWWSPENVRNTLSVINPSQANSSIDAGHDPRPQ